jgi:hypothetical protein
VILQRFPPGPDRQRWLTWLAEFSQAEQRLSISSELLFGDFPSDDEPDHTR